MTTTATTTPAPRHAASTPAPSAWATIYTRAVADKATLVAVLAFYGLALAVGVGALWPPLQDTFDSIANQMPAGFDAILGGLSIATPAGWMHAEMLSLMGPGFLIATAMISGAAATAGEEQARTLGLVLSTGTSRTTFLSAKAAATLTHVLIVAAAMFVGMLLANPVGDLGIPALDILAATVNMVLIALVYAAITLALGVITADKRLTLSVTGGLLAVSFISANFLGLNESLVWLSKINFWYPYSANPALAAGIDWGYFAIMAALTVGITAIAFVVFPRRRDLNG